MSFEIKLPLFEGPFDLLLFFIERDELDIHDIPIASVTDDFLDYLRQLEQVNIEVAGEFILVASTLMRIKAKMLLPRPELDEEGNEIDPREELIAHLLEYKRYKSVLEEFRDMEENSLGSAKRGNVLSEIRELAKDIDSIDEELQDVDLYKMLKVYQKLITRYENTKDQPVHRIAPYPYTVNGQKEFISKSLRDGKNLSFSEIILTNPEKIAVIFNFLAILELLQVQKIQIAIGEGYNDFTIEKSVA
ncbi:segregation and condensation protein A [Fulvitalea axinellae]|uniref:Segregation and condensation protein A n=1 Tax=Fulvitalea axinellae TaxID=1182444 RepID=A0AAU9CL49_9BACT|nr:segregation and condensation protein A [Fulvitalea axinellae]